MSGSEIEAWFAGRLPEGWFAGPAAVDVDDEEIWVVGPVDEPDVPRDAGAEAVAAARSARAQRFREETRDVRVRIAHEAQRRFGRLVAWGVTVGGDRHMFTRRSVPVMTRLHLPERRVLDTLVESGVARSRSDALAWCVRLVGRHQSDWIAQLREALSEVERLRRKGPA